MYQLITIFLSSLIAAQSSVNIPVTETHGLYLSVIEIHHPALSPTAELKIKVFKDDLQNALRNTFPNRPIPGKELLCENGQTNMQTYFSKHILCKINGQALGLEWSVCEKNNEAYWLVFKMQCPKKWKAVELKANFLMELFPAQANMVHIKNGAEKRFARLTKKKSTCEIIF